LQIEVQAAIRVGVKNFEQLQPVPSNIDGRRQTEPVGANPAGVTRQGVSH